MDQVTNLRRMAAAETAAGNTEMAKTLESCAATLERRASQNPQLKGVLIEAARKRSQGHGARRANPPLPPAGPRPAPPGPPARSPRPPAAGLPGGLPGNPAPPSYLPGALPNQGRRMVPQDVAALFDRMGEEMFNSILAHLAEGFTAELDGAIAKIKAQIVTQYGANGVTQYMPLVGEWADGILANVIEYGSHKIREVLLGRQIPQGTPPGAPQAVPPAPVAPTPPPRNDMSPATMPMSVKPPAAEPGTEPGKGEGEGEKGEKDKGEKPKDGDKGGDKGGEKPKDGDEKPKEPPKEPKDGEDDDSADDSEDDSKPKKPKKQIPSGSL